MPIDAAIRIENIDTSPHRLFSAAGGRKNHHERGAIALLLRLKRIFAALARRDFGVLAVRFGAAFRKFPIALVLCPLYQRFNRGVGRCGYVCHFITTVCQRVVDALLLALGDGPSFFFQAGDLRVRARRLGISRIRQQNDCD